MAPLPPDAVRTINAYQDQISAVRERVLGFVRRSYGTLDSWQPPEIDRFVAAIIPVVAGGQVLVAGLTDNYLATIERQILGTPAAAVGVPPELVSTETMRGVPAADVYGRTGSTIYGSLARGNPLGVAVAAGLARAVAMVGTDLQLARTHAAAYVGGQNSRIVGFRRVLSSDACSLCAESDGMFGRSELMPIHGSCECGSVAVFRGGPDPGLIGDAGTSPTADRGSPMIRQHGELGPVLTAAGDEFADV